MYRDEQIFDNMVRRYENEFPDYYVRLSKMEEKAEKYWDKK